MKLIKTKQIVSLFMAAVTTMSMFGIHGVSAATAPVIAPLTDASTAGKTLSIFESGYNGEYVGVYSFSASEKALELFYSTKKQEYRFCVRMLDGKKLAENQSWMVVTYKTDAKTKAEMKLNNCNNSEILLESDISKSNGQWVRTEAVNINDTALGGTNYFTRLRGGSWDYIVVKPSDSKTKLYIREIAFFTSKADADSYYKDKPASEVTDIPVEAEPERPVNLTPATLDGELGQFKVLTLLKGDGLGEWSYDEATGVKLHYTSDGSYGGNYRMMFRFTRWDTLPEYYNYVRVVYSAKNSSSETDKVSLVIVDPKTGEKAVLKDEVANTNGEYILSDTAYISDAMIDRLAGRGSYSSGPSHNYQLHCSLAFGSDVGGGEYYVRNIYFFNTKEGAEAFTAPEYKPTATEPTKDEAVNKPRSVQSPIGVTELKYDDRHTFNKDVSYVETVSVTSTSVETAEKDVAILKRVEGETFAASGIGEAKVVFTDGTSTTVKVTAAPINLLFIYGQSNGEGHVGSSATSIRNERGQVYSTYAPSAPYFSDVLIGKAFKSEGASIYNADIFTAESLTSTKNKVNAELNYPLDALCEGGIGKGGMDAAIAYKWNKETGEKVWIVNAAHSGTSINAWQPGNAVTDNEYWQAVKVTQSVQDTLKAEIAAGHYTLSHMGYYWLQGCSDRGSTAESYTARYTAMHEGFMRDLAFDHDSNPATPDKTLDFGGIVLVRSSYENNTARDFEMNGPRLSQYYMGNAGGSLENVYLISNVGDAFKSNAAVKSYFTEKYGNEANFKKESGNVTYKMPTTVSEVHPDIHYRQAGYTELGFDAAENTLKLLGYVKSETAAKISFIGADGNPVDVSSGFTMKSGDKITLVPVLTEGAPADGITYSIANGNLTVKKHYEFTSNGKPDTITFTAGDISVKVYVNTFIDVKESDSFYEAVNYAVSKGLFSGTSPTIFEPYTNMTRAMFVTVLGRLEGIDSTQYTKVSFNDVVAGSWYAPYVDWAASNGIVNGLSADEYGINVPITVEQACTILARYAEFAKSTDNTGLTPESFTDAAAISDWAKVGMAWAVENGVYTGADGKLAPNSNANRGLVAVMLKNYSEAFAEKLPEHLTTEGAILRVDLSSKDEADKTLNMFESGYNGEYVGVYGFDNSEKALKISYSAKQKAYRFCLRMSSAGMLQADQKWMVVTYKTTAKTSAKLNLFNCNDSNILLDADTSRSRGEWVKTAPVNINLSNLGDNLNHLTRLRNDSWVLITADLPEGEALYIKEIVFFESENDAKNYVK